MSFYNKLMSRIGVSEDSKRKYRLHFETVKKGMEGKYDITMPKTV